MGDGFLQQAYQLDTQEDTNEYYSAWAASYDEELIGQGYRTPQRCAEALVQFVERDEPILDIGCGTGLSGKALAAAGYTNISGTDVNEEMLAFARNADVYRHVDITNTDDPFPFTPGTYSAMTAVGVIGVGAAPLHVLGQCLDALAPGGHVCFSFNQHALEIPEFANAAGAAVAAGRAELLFEEDGPHIEGLGSRSTVYILRRSG